MNECRVGGFKEGTRNYVGFGEIMGFGQRNRLVANAVRAQEIKRKRNPKKELVIFETEIGFLLLRLQPSMPVYKFHINKESPVVLGGFLELHHFSNLREDVWNMKKIVSLIAGEMGLSFLVGR